MLNERTAPEVDNAVLSLVGCALLGAFADLTTARSFVRLACGPDLAVKGPDTWKESAP